MNTVTVNLNGIEAVKRFNTVVSTFYSEIDIVKGRYVIDAKSIMGIFSLDLSKPIDVVIHSHNEDEIVRFYDVMKEFK
jgi:phosphotransferase system HPr-like phosphotransfer protein